MRIAVADNGLGHLGHLYGSERFTGHEFALLPSLELPQTELAPYDVFIAPNGTDHVALFAARERVRRYLDDGGVVMCFCGWVTDWVPGAQWRMSTDIPLRTFAITAPLPGHALLRGIDLEQVNQTAHGKRGFWSCGYIEVTPRADVLLVDNKDRCLLFVDERTTRGAVLCTASGPLPGFGAEEAVFDRLFENALLWAQGRQRA